MKKILLSAAALIMGIANVSAQETTTVPYILSAVGDNTYAVTMTQEEITANYDTQWVKEYAWDMGVALPAGTVMFENDDLVIKAAVEKTPVYTKNGKITQIKEEFPSYTGYINAGSTLGQNNWADDVQIQDIADAKANNQGIVSVTPKKAGTLSFGAYAGDNSREIGIYQLATDEEKDNDNFGSMIAKNNFRNDGENGTVKNAPAYVEAEVAPGHDFALLAGGSKNLCVHQIKFVPSSSDGINTVNKSEAKTVVGVYTIAGAQVNGMQNGVNIVKYSDGSSVKVIK